MGTGNRDNQFCLGGRGQMGSGQPKEVWISGKGCRVSGMAPNGPAVRGDRAYTGFISGVRIEHKKLSGLETQ